MTIGPIGISQQLDTLQEHIDAMRTQCDEAQSRLRETNESCRSLLDRAGSLREQRYVTHCRINECMLISAFEGRKFLPDSQSSMRFLIVLLSPLKKWKL